MYKCLFHVLCLVMCMSGCNDMMGKCSFMRFTLSDWLADRFSSVIILIDCYFCRLGGGRVGKWLPWHSRSSSGSGEFAWGSCSTGQQFVWIARCPQALGQGGRCNVRTGFVKLFLERNEICWLPEIVQFGIIIVLINIACNICYLFVIFAIEYVEVWIHFDMLIV